MREVCLQRLPDGWSLKAEPGGPGGAVCQQDDGFRCQADTEKVCVKWQGQYALNDAAGLFQRFYGLRQLAQGSELTDAFHLSRFHGGMIDAILA